MENTLNVSEAKKVFFKDEGLTIEKQLENVEIGGVSYEVFLCDDFRREEVAPVVVVDLTDEDDFENITGDIARSDVEYSDYAYTHGGTIYRKAAEKAKEIANQ